MRAHDPDLWGDLSDGLDVDGRITVVTWGQLSVVFLDRSDELAPRALPFAAWTMGCRAVLLSARSTLCQTS